MAPNPGKLALGSYIIACSLASSPPTPPPSTESLTTNLFLRWKLCIKFEFLNKQVCQVTRGHVKMNTKQARGKKLTIVISKWHFVLNAFSNAGKLPFPWDLHLEQLKFWNELNFARWLLPCSERLLICTAEVPQPSGRVPAIPGARPAPRLPRHSSRGGKARPPPGARTHPVPWPRGNGRFSALPAPAGGRARPAHWSRRASLPAAAAAAGPGLPRRRGGSGEAGGGECRGGTAQPRGGAAAIPVPSPFVEKRGSGVAEPPPPSAVPDARPRPGAGSPGRPRGCGRSRWALLLLRRHHLAAGWARGCCRSGVGVCPPGSAGLGVGSSRKKLEVSGVKAREGEVFLLVLQNGGDGGGGCHIWF